MKILFFISTRSGGKDKNRTPNNPFGAYQTALKRCLIIYIFLLGPSCFFNPIYFCARPFGRSLLEADASRERSGQRTDYCSRVPPPTKLYGPPSIHSSCLPHATAHLSGRILASFFSIFLSSRSLS